MMTMDFMNQPPPPSLGRNPATLDAFVCYSRRDATVVMPIVAAARNQGRTLWVDEDVIPPAAPWHVELGTAIEAADAVVCCVSSAWSDSVECRREYERAVELGKRLVPVRVAEVGGVPPELVELQWIDAGREEPEAVATAVLRTIDTDPDQVHEHTYWLSLAIRWDGRGRDRSLLLRGKELRIAEDWLARDGVRPGPAPLQIALVYASRQAENGRLRTTVTAPMARWWQRSRANNLESEILRQQQLQTGGTGGKTRRAGQVRATIRTRWQRRRSIY